MDRVRRRMAPAEQALTGTLPAPPAWGCLRGRGWLGGEGCPLPGSPPGAGAPTPSPPGVPQRPPSRAPRPRPFFRNAPVNAPAQPPARSSRPRGPPLPRGSSVLRAGVAGGAAARAAMAAPAVVAEWELVSWSSFRHAVLRVLRRGRSGCWACCARLRPVQRPRGRLLGAGDRHVSLNSENRASEGRPAVCFSRCGRAAHAAAGLLGAGRCGHVRARQRDRAVSVCLRWWRQSFSRCPAGAGTCPAT